MFTRHLFAAAALMAATLSANAGAISSSPEASTTASSASLASDMSIVDASASLSGTGLANILASSDSQQQFALVKGVEGLYMLGMRVNAPLGTSTDAGSGVSAPAGSGADAGAALPTQNATDLPEPSSVALMLAGVLGAVGFTRGRKQG